MKRMGTMIATTVVALAMLGAPASAHVLVVEPPGQGAGPEGAWVGGGALPGQGKGLLPGGPSGEDLLSPAHGKGLNTVCEKQRKHGKSAVDMFGPPNPGTCGHGGAPPAS